MMGRRNERRSALIVGLGRFGTATAERLIALGWDVVGLDVSAEVVQHMRDRLGHVVQLDARDEEALVTMDVPSFDVCVVSSAAGIESSLLLVMNLQQLEARRIVAKAATEYHARILRRVGVEDIVFPERDAGVHLAENLQAPNLVQWIHMKGERDVALVSVPGRRAGTRLREWREIHRPSLYLLGRLTADGKPVDLNRDIPLQEGDTLVVVGPLDELLTLGQ